MSLCMVRPSLLTCWGLELHYRQVWQIFWTILELQSIGTNLGIQKVNWFLLVKWRIPNRNSHLKQRERQHSEVLGHLSELFRIQVRTWFGLKLVKKLWYLEFYHDFITELYCCKTRWVTTSWSCVLENWSPGPRPVTFCSREISSGACRPAAWHCRL